MKPSREQFIRLIDAIHEVRQRDNAFSEVLSEYLQSYSVVNSHDWFVDRVVEFTESLFCGCGKISYFINEQDFGMVKKDGVKHYSDAGELYDDLNKK